MVIKHEISVALTKPFTNSTVFLSRCSPVLMNVVMCTLALLVYLAGWLQVALLPRSSLAHDEQRRIPAPRAANHSAQPILSSSTVFRGDTKWVMWRDLGWDTSRISSPSIGWHAEDTWRHVQERNEVHVTRKWWPWCYDREGALTTTQNYVFDVTSSGQRSSPLDV